MARTKDDVLANKRKREILDAAARCFIAKGFHQASMRAICAEAGLSAGAVYNYFPSKDAIIEGMVEWERKEVDELAAYLETEANALVAVVEAVRAIVAETTADDAQLYAELIAEAGRNPDLRVKFAETNDLMGRSLHAAVTRGQRYGSITVSLKAEALLSLVIAIYEGFVGRVGTEGDSHRSKMADLAAYAVKKLLTPNP